MVSLAEVADLMMGLLAGAAAGDCGDTTSCCCPWFSTDLEGMDAWRASRLPLAALKRELKKSSELSTVSLSSIRVDS